MSVGILSSINLDILQLDLIYTALILILQGPLRISRSKSSAVEQSVLFGVRKTMVFRAVALANMTLNCLAKASLIISKILLSIIPREMNSALVREFPVEKEKRRG